MTLKIKGWYFVCIYYYTTTVSYFDSAVFDPSLGKGNMVF